MNRSHDHMKDQVTRSRCSVFAQVSKRMSAGGGRASEKRPIRNIERALSYVHPLHASASVDDPYLAGHMNMDDASPATRTRPRPHRRMRKTQD